MCNFKKTSLSHWDLLTGPFQLHSCHPIAFFSPRLWLSDWSSLIPVIPLAASDKLKPLPEIARNRPNLVGGIATYPSEKWWSESEWVTVGMMIISQLFMESHVIAMFQSPPVINWHGFQHPIGELGSTGLIWVPGTPRVGCGSKCSCKMANSASPGTFHDHLRRPE
jgi:hypothetical protein